MRSGSSSSAASSASSRSVASFVGRVALDARARRLRRCDAPPRDAESKSPTASSHVEPERARVLEPAVGRDHVRAARDRARGVRRGSLPAGDDHHDLVRHAPPSAGITQIRFCGSAALLSRPLSPVAPSSPCVLRIVAAQATRRAASRRPPDPRPGTLELERCFPKRHVLGPSCWTPWSARASAGRSTSTRTARGRRCSVAASRATSTSAHPRPYSSWGRPPATGAPACRGSRSPPSASSPARPRGGDGDDRPSRARRARDRARRAPLECRTDAPRDRLHEPTADERRGHGRAPVRPRPGARAARRRRRAHRGRLARRAVGAASLAWRRPGLQSRAG